MKQRIGLLALGWLAACSPRPALILLFTGTGTSPGDVRAVERLLDDSGLAYRTVSSRQLVALSEPELRAYRLLIVPGGNFEAMGNSLTPAAAATVRAAVQHGLNYIGLCAGAFMAGDSPYNGFNLTSGVRFPFYAIESRGVHKAAVTVTFAGAAADHYWEDGPQLAGWGGVVARYPDGTPAIVQGRVGQGWIILTGIHPEAPDSWRRGLTFTTPARADNAYAVTLIRAGLDGRALPELDTGR